MKCKMYDYGACKLPTRGHYNDAGLDCYANDTYTLRKGEIVCAGLGFGVDIPNGYVATLKPRSSMNIKGILTLIGTIDSGYKGEIRAVFINTQNEPYTINKGDKICQLVVSPIAYVDLVESYDMERGQNGFGSTGK